MIIEIDGKKYDVEIIKKNNRNTYIRVRDGKIIVTTNYLVPVLESGIVVYIGKKEHYGNVIIIQGMDGVDISYSNMLSTSVKLYDYIEKGDLLGEVDGNKLYLVYSEDGKVLNYEEYLK